jgi:hypothetical protein
VYGESQGQKGWLFTNALKLDCDPATLAVSDPGVATLPGVNAFYFTSGIGAQSSCKDIPPAGLFVQSPKGARVTFRLNGADIVMASTGIITLTGQVAAGTVCRSCQINIWTIEGEIDVFIGGIRYKIPAGNARTFPLGGSDGLLLSGQPGPLRPISFADPSAPAFVKTLCSVATAAGLKVEGCDIKLAATRRPNTPVSTLNACQPTQPGLPCNCNGFCDPGESYYTCPQDCPFAPIAGGPACIANANKCNPTTGLKCCAGLSCQLVPGPTPVFICR